MFDYFRPVIFCLYYGVIVEIVSSHEWHLNFSPKLHQLRLSNALEAIGEKFGWCIIEANCQKYLICKMYFRKSSFQQIFSHKKYHWVDKTGKIEEKVCKNWQ